MAGRSLQASAQGIQIIRKAIKRDGWKQDELKDELGLRTRQPITRLLRGEPIERSTFEELCHLLGLKVEDVMALEVAQTEQPSDIDELIQRVRSHTHDNIQRLHGKMQLWGIDHQVPLSELFVDVNILEEVSSSRRAELHDLWQDFSENPSYRSLDRIGLGKEQKRVSGLAMLEKGTNLMVLGKPGSGKTTYLQRIVVECNAGRLHAQKVPALIKLREFVDDGEPFQYSLEQYLAHNWNVSEAEATLILRQGRSLVLLDGLDEVMGEKGKQILKQIKQFARTYPSNQLIVTFRIQSQKTKFERFDYIEVADFDKTQVETFSEHWFKAIVGDKLAGLEKAQEFLNQLFQEENRSICDLATTPILLSLTCLVFHRTGKFYSKRSKLYEEGIKLLLGERDKLWGIERDEIYRDLSVERKIELLSYLAVKKFNQSQYVLFEQKELESYIEEFLKIGQQESQAVLRAIESQNGLLIERSYKVWSFSHLTFQEYFVARWFCDRCDWSKLAHHVIDAHWREVFLLAAEIGGLDEDNLIKDMKANIDNFLRMQDSLQKFIERVNEKANSISLTSNSEQELKIARAFYFYLNRNDVIELDPDSGSFLSQKLIFINDIKTALRNPNNLDFSLDYKLALLLYNAYSLAADEYGGAASYSHLYKILIGDFEKLKNYEIEAGLKDVIQEFEVSLPHFSWKNWEDFKKWGLTSGRDWADRLRRSLVEYRNIRHSIEEDSQWNLIHRYHDANQLLVECLDRFHKVDKETRKEIEETLFLPIAEIEKRKRESTK